MGHLPQQCLVNAPVWSETPVSALIVAHQGQVRAFLGVGKVDLAVLFGFGSRQENIKMLGYPVQ